MAINTTQNSSQPTQLYILTFSEFWDRFSYYGLQALLVLYVTKIFLFSDNTAYGLYGAFTALAFATPVIGGFLADRVLGFYRAIIIGALYMMAGNFLLIFSSQHSMYLGLGFMVVGIGLFKPNNVSFVGTLYQENDIRREAGFSIFYIGMNIGALLGPLLYGYIAIRYGWHFGFIISLSGIFLSLLLFILKCQYSDCLLNKLDSFPTKLFFRLSFKHLLYFFILCIAVISAILIQHAYLFGNLLIFTGIVTIFVLLIISSQLNMEDRNRLFALSILSFFCIFFFACSLQTGSSLTLFIERDINRDIFGINIPTMAFSSLEPFFIILSAPFLAGFWNWLRKKKYEPAVSIKVSIGLFLAAVSFLIFALAAHIHTTHYLPLGLIILGNFILGLGELCVLPVVMAVISQFSPTTLKGTCMGILFLSLAYSGYLSGAIARIISTQNVKQHLQVSLVNYSHIFIEIFYITAVISIVLFCLNPWIKRLLYGTESSSTSAANL